MFFRDGGRDFVHDYLTPGFFTSRIRSQTYYIPVCNDYGQCATASIYAVYEADPSNISIEVIEGLSVEGDPFMLSNEIVVRIEMFDGEQTPAGVYDHRYDQNNPPLHIPAADPNQDCLNNNDMLRDETSDDDHESEDGEDEEESDYDDSDDWWDDYEVEEDDPSSGNGVVEVGPEYDDDGMTWWSEQEEWDDSWPEEL